MATQKPTTRQLLKAMGPGLIFASASIGTSHLVLSTRAGAHHGMVYFWIIIGAMLLKYPFFEFSARYANATGHSLLKGYKDQGTWAVLLFLSVIFVGMFCVAGAVAAVSAGLLSTILGIQGISIQVLAGLILLASVALLLLGGYTGLDRLTKLISLVLFVTMTIAFFAVVIKGPIDPIEGFQAPSIIEGAGLTLLISLIGWMPSGLESSTMNSIWVVEKIRATNYHPTLKESLFDFNFGYVFTAILALMFLVIGAFTVYGSGELLEGSAVAFSSKLLHILTASLGEWAFPVIGISAFGTIYGTLIGVLDAFPRSFVRGWRVLKFAQIEKNEEQLAFLSRGYQICVAVVGLGGFLLFYFSAASMISMLELATIISFLVSPFIGFLNLRAIRSESFPQSARPPQWMMVLAYVGLAAMIGFGGFYVVNLITG